MNIFQRIERRLAVLDAQLRERRQAGVPSEAEQRQAERQCPAVAPGTLIGGMPATMTGAAATTDWAVDYLRDSAEEKRRWPTNLKRGVISHKELQDLYRGLAPKKGQQDASWWPFKKGGTAVQPAPISTISTPQTLSTPEPRLQDHAKMQAEIARLRGMMKDLGFYENDLV